MAKNSKSMEKSLSPIECLEMRMFFKSLIKNDDLAKDSGLKLDVMQFLKEYRIAINGRFTESNKENRKIWTKENVGIAVHMRNSGKSWGEVAKVFGVSRQAAMLSVMHYAKERLA